MSEYFTLFVKDFGTLKTTLIEISGNNIINPMSPNDIGTLLNINALNVPTNVVFSNSNTTLTFKNGNTVLFEYSYTLGSPNTQTISITDTTYDIMSDVFLLNYTIYSECKMSQSPTFVTFNDNGAPPTLILSEINTLDSTFGTNDIQFKVTIENISLINVSRTVLTGPSNNYIHYQMTLNQNGNTLGFSYITENTVANNAFYNKSNAEIEGITISNISADIVYDDTQTPNAVRELEFFVNDGGQITVGGATIGDPFILPVYGDRYELPMKKTAFRMLQGYKLIMNASTRRITKCEGEQIKQYYEQTTQKKAPLQLITKGVFYDKVFLKSEGNVLEYDFNTGKGSMSSDYFTVAQCNKPYYSSITNILSNNRYIKVSFNHSKYGAIHIKLNHFTNPQIKYGFDFNVKRINDLTGLFIREYKYKSMICRKLKNTKKCHGIIGKNKILSVLRN